MPTHSKSRDSATAAAAAALAARKRGPGGKALGKSAIRAIVKNSIAVEEYLSAAETASDAAELVAATARDGLLLGRVIRPLGAGNLEVLLQTGETIRIPIGGSIRFKGRAGSKTDRENCMVAGDIIVVRSAFAAGKLLPGTTAHVTALFERLGVRVPTGFFGSAERPDEDEGWEWDRAADAAEEATARKMATAAGGAGDAAAAAADDDADIDLDAI
jgi:translation initiation factor IF-1